VNLLEGNKDHRCNNHCQHEGVICDVSLGLAVVKGREKFHEALFHKPRYKTALPVLEIYFLDICLAIISKINNVMLWKGEI
jgi:hypothetical protein